MFLFFFLPDIIFLPWWTQSLPTYFVGFMADIIVARYVIFAFGFLLAVAASFFYSHLLRYESVGQVRSSITYWIQILSRILYRSCWNKETLPSIIIFIFIFILWMPFFDFITTKRGISFEHFFCIYLNVRIYLNFCFTDITSFRDIVIIWKHFFLFCLFLPNFFNISLPHFVVCVLDKSGDDFHDDVCACSIVSVHCQ